MPRMDKYSEECEEQLFHPIQNLFQMEDPNQTKLSLEGLGNITVTTVYLVQLILGVWVTGVVALIWKQTLFHVTSTPPLVVVLRWAGSRVALTGSSLWEGATLYQVYLPLIVWPKGQDYKWESEGKIDQNSDGGLSSVFHTTDWFSVRMTADGPPFSLSITRSGPRPPVSKNQRHLNSSSQDVQVGSLLFRSMASDLEELLIIPLFRNWSQSFYTCVIIHSIPLKLPPNNVQQG